MVGKVASWLGFLLLGWIVFSLGFATGVEASRQRTRQAQAHQRIVSNWYGEIKRREIARFN